MMGVVVRRLCYGIHYLFNIITNDAHTADAVLIRALEPIDGIDVMLQRRGMDKIAHRITAGPGSGEQGPRPR
jgi:DNA-3-methyladenine glycosylase